MKKSELIVLRDALTMEVAHVRKQWAKAEDFLAFSIANPPTVGSAIFGGVSEKSILKRTTELTVRAQGQYRRYRWLQKYEAAVALRLEELEGVADDEEVDFYVGGD